MINIFDTTNIKIKLRDFSDPVIGIVTINLNEQLEIRYAPIRWKESRTAIFFTMPSLKLHGYQKCAVILNENEYKTFHDNVIKKFLELAKETYNRHEYSCIEKAVERNKQKEEVINLDDIQI